jgi:hypothetical protein
MNRRAWLVMLLAFVSPVPASAQEQPGWRAGVAKTIITPRQSIWMSGYGGRTKPAQGKETELWAKALVLEDAKGHKAVLVTLDLVGIGRDIADQVCKRLQGSYGFVLPYALRPGGRRQPAGHVLSRRRTGAPGR